jgi:hypothetical protein
LKARVFRENDFVSGIIIMWIFLAGMFAAWYQPRQAGRSWHFQLLHQEIKL